MNASKRLNLAIQKLYTAFHNNQLHPECCQQCAVGNILDNKDSWKHLSDHHGSLQLNYLGLVHQNLGRKFNGYTPQELLQIEACFLKACGYALPLHPKNKKPRNPQDKELLFNGLAETVRLLCELDDVENVMDHSKLFDIENDNSKYALSEMMA